MLGKYDFDDLHLPKVLEYFDTTSAFAFTCIDLVIQFFNQNNLKFKKFEKIKEMFLGIQYLDEFQEVRDEFYFAYEDASFFLIKLENERKKIDFDDIRIKLFTAKEAFLIIDNLIRYCYDFVKKSNVVPSTQHIVEFVLNKAKFYLSQFLVSSVYETNIFTHKQLDNFKSLMDIGDINHWEEIISREINLFEYNWHKQKEIVKFLDDINLNYWKVYGLLIQIRTLIDITFLI